MRCIRTCFAATILLVLLLPPVCAAERSRKAFQVVPGEGRILYVKADQVQTIVFGNNEIAEAVVHDKNTIIVIGKSEGMTNLIALNKSGKIIAEHRIQVSAHATVLEWI
jgi:Flp pilus assembly secretin CpaC